MLVKFLSDDVRTDVIAWVLFSCMLFFMCALLCFSYYHIHQLVVRIPCIVVLPLHVFVVLHQQWLVSGTWNCICERNNLICYSCCWVFVVSWRHNVRYIWFTLTLSARCHCVLFFALCFVVCMSGPGSLHWDHRQQTTVKHHHTSNLKTLIFHPYSFSSPDF